MSSNYKPLDPEHLAQVGVFVTSESISVSHVKLLYRYVTK